MGYTAIVQVVIGLKIKRLLGATLGIWWRAAAPGTLMDTTTRRRDK
jgi:hypothetical protein